MQTELYQYFEKSIQPIFRSTIITADMAIDSFLCDLTQNKELFAIIVDANKDFSYKIEFSKAVLTLSNGKTFCLPQQKKKIIAIVTRLLYDFIRKRDSIVDFIMTYFKSNSHQESYVEFLDKIITPYATAFSECIRGEEAVAIDEAVLDEISPVTSFSDNALEEIAAYLDKIKDDLHLSSDFTDVTRDELMTLLDGTIYVLESHNAVLMRTAFIGLKNTLLLYRIGLRELKEIEKLFLSYGVI